MGCSNDSKHYTLLHKTFANAKGHLALPGQYLHAAAPPASTTSSSRNTPNCTTTETISICPYLSPARVEGGRERERERAPSLLAAPQPIPIAEGARDTTPVARTTRGLDGRRAVSLHPAAVGCHERGAGRAVGGQRCPLRHLPAVSAVALLSPYRGALGPFRQLSVGQALSLQGSERGRH